MENPVQQIEENTIMDLIPKMRILYFDLKNQRWKLILLVILGGVAGFFYAKSQKPKYTAKLTFALAESGDKLGSIGSIASQFGIDLMGGGSAGAFSGDNLLELMKSRLLVEKTLLTVVDSAGKPKLLVNQYIDFNKPKKPKPRKSEDPVPVYFTGNEEKKGYSLAQDSFLAKISSELTKKNLIVAKIDKKLAIVSVTFTGNDQWFAKNFTQILVQNVTEFYIETKTGQMRKNVKMLEHKVDSVKYALGKAMYGVASEVDGNHFLVRGVAKVPQAKKQLEIQVLTAMYGELIKNLELSRTLMAKDQPLIQLIDQPRFPLEKKKTSKLIASVIGSFLAFCVAVINLLLLHFWKIYKRKV
jgi:hypothetical protein